MSADHTSIQQELAAYALGGLDPETTACIEQHLQACADCRALVREYEAVKDLLPFALPTTQPSPAGRLALLRQLQSGAPERQTGRGRRMRLRWPWPTLRSRVLPVGLAVSLLILGTLFGLWWQQPGDSSQSAVAQLRARPDVHVVSLMGTGPTPAAGGQLLFTSDLSQAAVEVSGLPALPASRTYQVWFDQSDQTWTSGGVFRVDQTGTADVMVRFPSALSAYRGCWITEEPAGGSTSPSGSLVLTTSGP
jgi:anti-sigma factor RsiW